MTSKYNSKYYEENKEKVKNNMRMYYASHKDRLKEYAKFYYQMRKSEDLEKQVLENLKKLAHIHEAFDDMEGSK